MHDIYGIYPANGKYFGVKQPDDRVRHYEHPPMAGANSRAERTV
jgi:hypothetical protein